MFGIAVVLAVGVALWRNSNKPPVRYAPTDMVLNNQNIADSFYQEAITDPGSATLPPNAFLTGLRQEDNAEAGQKIYGSNQLYALSYLKSLKLAMVTSKISELKVLNDEFRARAGFITSQDLTEGAAIVGKWSANGGKVGKIVPVAGETAGRIVGALIGAIAFIIAESLDNNGEMDVVAKETLQLRYFWFTTFQNLGMPPAACIHWVNRMNDGSSLTPEKTKGFLYRFDAVEFTRVMIDVLAKTEKLFPQISQLKDETVVPFYDPAEARKLWAKGEISIVNGGNMIPFRYSWEPGIHKQNIVVEGKVNQKIRPIYCNYIMFPQLLLRHKKGAYSSYQKIVKQRENVVDFFRFSKSDLNLWLQSMRKSAPVLRLKVGHLPSSWENRKGARVASTTNLIYNLARDSWIV